MKKKYLLICVLAISSIFANCKKETTQPTEDTSSSANSYNTSPMKETGTVTETVIIRSGPGKEYDKVTCNEFGKNEDGTECSHSGCYRTLSQLDAGAQVEIVEKSETVTVDKWTNRWLKIRLNSNINCDTEETWIFGEFVR